MMLVEISDVPPVSLIDTQGNQFIEIGSVQATAGYYNTLHNAVVRSSVPDTITASGMGNYPSFVVHQMTGVGRIGAYSTGNGSSNTPAVSSFLAVPGSYVYAVLLAYTNGTGYAINAGPGYTQIGVYPGFISDEFLSAASGSTTSQFFMTMSTRWGEISVNLLP